MRDVNRTEFAAFINSRKLTSKPVHTEFQSVMQFFDKKVLVAQSIYKRGYCPMYQIKEGSRG